MSLLARLIEAGTPADLVAEVARELARAEVAQEAIEQRRAKDRERQARKRESDEGNVMSRDTADVTVDPAPSLPPNENNSNPPTHPHPENKTRARKGTRLSVDWVPAPLPAAMLAVVDPWPPGMLERELAQFRDWAASATGPNAVKADWDAAWRNWLRNAEKDGRYRKNGTAIQQRGATGAGSNLSLAIAEGLEFLG